ncbi:MAG: hypothetical protein JWN93_3789 [Hyphomicrobiales bacterium]|nr:hypothetical protein [Hyphomicrobiales bacterium]
MGISKGILLGSATALLAVAGAQAADLPGRKAAPVEYVKVCDAYGAGFFFIPGTDTCIKVGGYVRVDYDYRPARKNTQGDSLGVLSQKNASDLTTSGFYNRGTAQLDARTQSAWGTVQTVMALRMESGGGIQSKVSTGPSLEAAYVRFAGFTFGQASQPFAFMSSWAYNTHYWTGWPNGVRQIAYTYTFGGGFSATIAATDAKSYNAVSQAVSNPSGAGTVPGKDETISQPNRAGVVWVGNVRYDQAWGSAQVMGAYQRGGDLAGKDGVNVSVAPNVAVTGTNETGFALGAGVAVNLPMLAAGDRIELIAVYADRLANLLADGGINTPSAAAYGLSPLGGPSTNFANGTGYSFGMNLRHYWTPTIRSQVYASYTTRKLHTTADGVAVGTGTSGKNVLPGAEGKAYSLGHALIWTPVTNFDIGLELTYIRAEWNSAAVKSTKGWETFPTAVDTNNFIGKVRVQRNF